MKGPGAFEEDEHEDLRREFGVEERVLIENTLETERFSLVKCNLLLLNVHRCTVEMARSVRQNVLGSMAENAPRHFNRHDLSGICGPYKGEEKERPLKRARTAERERMCGKLGVVPKAKASPNVAQARPDQRCRPWASLRKHDQVSYA